MMVMMLVRQGFLRAKGGPREFNVNLYATKKTAAQGLLDLALLMANASQLKSIVQTQGDHQ